MPIPAFVSLLLVLLPLGQAAAEKPNFVLIFADDLGYGDLSCYGATKLKTPNIDRLAEDGRRFTDAHSASAVCTPSRYALLTGRYPFRRGLTRPVFLKSGLVVDPGRTTVADVMKKAGYATACIGKWHLGFGGKTPDWNGDLKPGPLELGFDYYFGVPTVNSHPPFVYVENHRVVGLLADDPFVYGKRANTQVYPEKMRLDDIGGADAAHALYRDEAVGAKLAEKSVEWIAQNKGKPFFLYLATTNIHHPFTPAKRFQGTSECGLYGDFVHELDWIVGEVMRTLEEQGVADNTLVIFTSDNGGMINQTGQRAISMGHRLNGDLLGFKFDAWEGGHRVPFIARWPGKIEAGSVSEQLIGNVDILATMAALTGQELVSGAGPDSFNVLPALTGNPSSPIRDHLVLGAAKPGHLALRDGNWMFIGARGGGGFTSSKPGTHAFGGPAALKFAGQANSDVADGKLKKMAPPAQLYDLGSDPSQAQNVFEKYPDRAAEMRTRLEAIRAGEATVPELDVYLFAGQSNMDGRGKVEKLTEEQRRPFFSASIYYRNPPHSSLGWKVLAPGFSIPPKHKGGLPSPTFGPEMGFAFAMGQAQPDRRFAFIKGSKGGTSLRKDWKPGIQGEPETQGERYRYFVETVKQATGALAADGQRFRICGLLWHQGESDSKASAGDHQKRLKEFAARIREDVGVPDLPIAVGQVFDNGRRDSVRAALRAFSEADPAGALVSAEGLTTWDAGTHFDASSQLLLGERFAEAILKLQSATKE